MLHAVGEGVADQADTIALLELEAARILAVAGSQKQASSQENEYRRERCKKDSTAADAALQESNHSTIPFGAGGWYVFAIMLAERLITQDV
jgi:hypothetical protein